MLGRAALECNGGEIAEPGVKCQDQSDAEERPAEPTPGIPPPSFGVQVQRASDTAKFAAVRIGGVENERFADDERSFEDLQHRISRTLAFLAAAPRAVIDGKEDTIISATIGRTPVTIAARDYALQFASGGKVTINGQEFPPPAAEAQQQQRGKNAPRQRR